MELATRASDADGDLGRYFSILLRRKWLILAVVAIVLIAVGVRTYTAPRLYRSTAKIRIDHDDNVLPYTGVQTIGVISPDQLQTQTQLLKSRTLMKRVISRLKLGDGRNETAEVNRLIGNLQATPVPYTQLIQVVYSAPDPQFAANVVNAIAEEYIAYGFDSRYEATTRARDFLEGQLEDMRKAVRASEEALLRYTRANSQVWLLSEPPQAVRQRMEDLTRELTLIESKLLSTDYDGVDGKDPDKFPASLKTEAMRTLDMRLYTLDAQLTSLTGQFGPQWPEVKRLEGEVAALKGQLQQERDRVLQQARAEHDLAEQHQTRLVAAIMKQNDQVLRLGEDAIQYNILKRDVETNQRFYEGLLQRMKEASVSATLESGNIRIVDAGEVAQRPYSPDVTLNLLLGLAAGLVAGVLIAFVRESTDQRVTGSREVQERLGLQVLGVIPDFRRVGAGRMLPGSAGWAPPRLPAAMSEHYRSLRTWVLMAGNDQAPRTVLVTSAIPGEGKTLTSLNLAVSFAQTGACTLLVEFDLRKPRLRDWLALSPEIGLSRCLEHPDRLAEQIAQTSVPNLSVLPAGPLTGDPSGLIGEPLIRTLLTQLSERFTYVVIDSPPLLPVTDALVLSTLVEGVLLVIRGERTPRDAIREAHDQLRRAGARVLGTVVNRAEPRHGPTAYDDYHYAADAYASAVTPAAIAPRRLRVRTITPHVTDLSDKGDSSPPGRTR
jgi:capsular exopolysaccharide synthesis family protein